jgi:hypothetical protein
VTTGGLANFFSNFVSKKAEVLDDNVDICEVERYLRMPQIPVQDSTGSDQDILLWWKDNASVIPNLSKMARQFLAAPASSASAERLFSGAGKMHDDLKKCTSESTLEDMLIVGHNFDCA